VRRPLYVLAVAWPDAQTHGAVRPPLRAMHGHVSVRGAGGRRDLQSRLGHDGYLVSRGCHVAAIRLGHYVELRAYGVAGYRQPGVERAAVAGHAVLPPLNVARWELDAHL